MTLTIHHAQSTSPPYLSQGVEFNTTTASSVFPQIGKGYWNKRGWLVKDIYYEAPSLEDTGYYVHYKPRVGRGYCNPDYYHAAFIVTRPAGITSWIIRITNNTTGVSASYEVNAGATALTPTVWVASTTVYLDDDVTFNDITVDCTTKTHAGGGIWGVLFYYPNNGITMPANVFGGLQDDVFAIDSTEYGSDTPLAISTIYHGAKMAIRAFEWIPSNVLSFGLGTDWASSSGSRLTAAAPNYINASWNCMHRGWIDTPLAAAILRVYFRTWEEVDAIVFVDDFHTESATLAEDSWEYIDLDLGDYKGQQVRLNIYTSTQIYGLQAAWLPADMGLL